MKPAAEPTLEPMLASTLEPAMEPAQAKPLPSPASPPPPPTQITRVHLSAYAKDFTVAAESGRQSPLPLETQRSDGGMSLEGGAVAIPEDGYYMALWELGVAGANGEATLQLGINGAASQLTYALHPGYDSGQQVTWLGAGDTLGLFLQAEDDKAEVNCSNAQFTVIRLG